MHDNLLTTDLIKVLNDATKAYDEGCPIMSDKDWDKLYFELVNREKNSGIIYPNSPTQKVNYDVVSELQKVKHNHTMLSLDKTKDKNVLIDFIESYPGAGCIEMLKMDGLTCSLTYKNNKLVKAETRGDGEIGEDVTHNANVVKNIPKTIPFDGELIVDGEIICTYDDFKPFSELYKNPRNFASGSIRLLDSKECRNRNLSFVCWDIISDVAKTLSEKLEIASKLGFDVVPWISYSGNSTLEYDEDWLKRKASEHGYPIDGLVFKYDDCETYYNLGYTDHHFRGGLAYKFYDETYSTKLRNIDWDVSRTGTLTPVAIFDPVDIKGSTVSRASLHNLTLMDQTLGIPYEGQNIEVFKANEIIPQIYSAEKDDNPKNRIEIPTRCPVCGETLVRMKEGVAETLNCVSESCKGKVVNRLSYFSSKGCMDIDGLARNTLEDMYTYLGVRSLADLYRLKEEQLFNLPNFKDTSVHNVYSAIQKSRKVALKRFLTAIGITNVGAKQAEQICSICDTWDDFRSKVANNFDWTILEGFGEIKANTINSFNYSQADEVVPCLSISNEKNSTPVSTTNGKLVNKKIVITGSLTHFKNRNEFAELVQSNGGIIQGGVNKETDLLVNNDVNSNSIKNKKAKELGVRIISEDDFMKEFFT